jgi:hypothetical protein
MVGTIPGSECLGHVNDFSGQVLAFFPILRTMEETCKLRHTDTFGHLRRQIQAVAFK